MDEPRRQALSELLGRAQQLGFVGPGLVSAQIDHALAWAEALGPFGGTLLDLGSGAGLPGLVLALEWPACRATLLDAQRRRALWLARAVDALGLEARVTACCARAEVAGRDPELREHFDLVVARGLGRPGAVAELGAAFVRVGGRLSVSEPPAQRPERWPREALAELGFGPARRTRRRGASFVILGKDHPLANRFPRRIGLPQHRPRW